MRRCSFSDSAVTLTQTPYTIRSSIKKKEKHIRKKYKKKKRGKKEEEKEEKEFDGE